MLFLRGKYLRLFAQIQTYNGADTPDVRVRNISNTSFEVTMNELVATNVTSEFAGRITQLGSVVADGKHASETLGWMALSIG